MWSPLPQSARSKSFHHFQPATVTALVWAGFRGGGDFDRACVVASGDGMEPQLSAVIFTIVVQGLTIGRVARRAWPALVGRNETRVAPDAPPFRSKASGTV